MSTQPRKAYPTDVTDEQWQLIEPLRLQEGREETPSAACIDSPSVKTTEVGGEERGYDGGKKIKGRKRHLLVDTLGLLLAVVLSGANVDDGPAAPRVLEKVTPKEFARLAKIFGDNKYPNKALQAWLQKERSDWQGEVNSPPTDRSGFTPVQLRWAVERSNSWPSRCRCNSKDYERRPDSSAAMIQLSHIHVLLRRLAPVERPKFHYARPEKETQKNTGLISG